MVLFAYLLTMTSAGRKLLCYRWWLSWVTWIFGIRMPPGGHYAAFCRWDELMFDSPRFYDRAVNFFVFRLLAAEKGKAELKITVGGISVGGFWFQAWKQNEGSKQLNPYKESKRKYGKNLSILDLLNSSNKKRSIVQRCCGVSKIYECIVFRSGFTGNCCADTETGSGIWNCYSRIINVSGLILLWFMRANWQYSSIFL